MVQFLTWPKKKKHSLMQKSYHYIGLLKAIMRLSMTAMKAADAKEVSASVSAIANEKIKAEKEATVSKKKQGTWFHLFFILSISKILRHFETLCFFWVMDFEKLVKWNSLVQKREKFSVLLLYMHLLLRFHYSFRGNPYATTRYWILTGCTEDFTI